MSQKKQYNPVWLKSEKFWYTFWQKAEPPWRPSRGEINLYEKIIKKVMRKNKNPKALVLGSTSEIRDLLAKYKNIETTVIDLNLPVHRAVSRLMKRKNLRERLVVADWLKMPLPSCYFDLVFGHGNFENIKIKKHDLFYQNISQVLKKDGLTIIARSCLETAFRRPVNFEYVIRKYKKDPQFFKNFQNRVWILYRLVSQPGVYDHQAQGVKFHVLMRKLLKEAKKQGLSNKEMRNLQWMPELDPYTYYVEVDIKSLKKLKSMIQKYFIIETVYQDSYHPAAKFNYDFVLRSKN